MIKIKHFKNLRLPVRASAFYTVVAALSKAAGLLFTPIFTRIMSPEEYGGFTLYISVLGICTVACTALASGGGMYKAYSLFPSDAKVITAAACGFSAAAAIPVCAAVIIFSEYLGLSPRLAPFLFLQLVCDGAISARLSELRYRYSYKEAAYLTLPASLGTPILSIFLMRALPGELARVVGLLLFSFAAASPTLLSAVRLGAFKPKLWKKTAGFCLPMLPAALTTSILSQADKLILAAYFGKAHLASYAVAHSIGIGLTFITGSLGSALHPWLIRKMSQGENEKIKKTITDITTVLGALTVFVVLVAPEALSILTPKAYSVALPAILPTALSVLPIFALSMLSMAAIHASKPIYYAISCGVGALVNVLSNLLLIPRISYLGAGLSLLFAYIAANLACYLLLRRCNDPSKLSPAWLALCFTLTALLSALGAALYPYPAARLVLALVPLLVLLVPLRSSLGYITEAESDL